MQVRRWPSPPTRAAAVAKSGPTPAPPTPRTPGSPGTPGTSGTRVSESAYASVHATADPYPPAAVARTGCRLLAHEDLTLSARRGGSSSWVCRRRRGNQCPVTRQGGDGHADHRGHDVRGLH